MVDPNRVRYRGLELRLPSSLVCKYTSEHGARVNRHES